MSSLINQVKSVYSDLNSSNISDLESIYSDTVKFIDPLNMIIGKSALLQHFSNVYENVLSCRFLFSRDSETLLEEQAYLSWTMEFQHRQLNGGKLISVDGISHIKFEDQVFYHRDWYDAGAMIYEHIPLLGAGVRLIKRKQSA